MAICSQVLNQDIGLSATTTTTTSAYDTLYWLNAGCQITFTGFTGTSTSIQFQVSNDNVQWVNFLPAVVYNTAGAGAMIQDLGAGSATSSSSEFNFRYVRAKLTPTAVTGGTYSVFLCLKLGNPLQ